MKPLSVATALLLGATLLRAQEVPATVVEMTGLNAYAWADDLYAWSGGWQGPQAIWDRGEHQDDPDAWTQTSNDEGSTWWAAAPGTGCGILVVDMKQVRTINRFSVFQMMDSDGSITAISIFRNSAFTGDLAPCSTSKGWKAVVKQHAVETGVNDGDSVSSPTKIEVPDFSSRYLMLQVYNTSSPEGSYIEFKGIKAFLDDSENVLRGGPTACVSVEPPGLATTEPGVGDYAVEEGVPVDISTDEPEALTFLGWATGGSVEVDDGSAADTTATFGADGGEVTARFELDELTRGMTGVISADDAGIEAFTTKPTLRASFTDPVSGKARTLALKVLTKPTADDPQEEITFEWNRNVRLFDAKCLTASEKLAKTAGWFTGEHQHQLPLQLQVSGADLPEGPASVPVRGLTAPIVEDDSWDETAQGDATLTLTGEWFGTVAPKVWREYVIADPVSGEDVIYRQPMKVLKPTVDTSDFTDSKGKPSCMDPETGESSVTVIVPEAPATGELNGIVVVESRAGLGAWETTWP
jgi:hypothetical protein